MTIPAAVDRRDRLRHAVQKRLDADEAGRRRGDRLGDQMLAAAEADLQANAPTRQRERGRRAGRAAAPSRSTASAGSRSAIETGAARRQRLALAAAEERIAPSLAGRARQATALRIVSTRSVRSHEKPPSASGARPK